MRLFAALPALVLATLHPRASFAGDCDDPTSSPAAHETCGNGIDDDCDGVVDDCSRAATVVADFTVQGAEAAGFGSNVRTADANGDGVADLLIGQPRWNGGWDGAAAVIYGPGAGKASSADAGIFIEGPTLASFGYAMAGGDYNGDGYDDVLVGAPGTDVNSAYLYYGPVTDADSSSDADVIIEGKPGRASQTASAVLIVPDHDGDGSADLLVGVPGAPQPGKIMLLSGDLKSTTSLLDDSALSYRGDGHDGTGCALADLGDQNGDGLEDLLVGACLDAEAYVLEGGTPHDHSRSVRDAASAILSDTRGRAIGGFGTVLAASDLDGDGYGDALVSAPWEHTVHGDSAGRVYAFRGPFSSDLDTNDAYARWETSDTGGWFGSALASGGDVNGDGEPDTLIGDAYEDASPWSVVYLHLGDASGTVDARHMASFTTDAEAWLNNVAFVPDWSGDGLDEIAIGVPGATAGAANGHVSVIFSDSLVE